MRRPEDILADALAQTAGFCRSQQLTGLRVAAAVSGGADSMALLRLLLLVQPQVGFQLSACHVNHGLRGQAADRDEAFVRAECARLGVPLQVFSAPKEAVPDNASEDWARQLRYGHFESQLAQGIDRVATAHTATDQAETLLFRLARGAGLHGAAGIRPVRGAYLRPLLGLTRAETEAVCQALGQLWVTDETNHSDAYARNRLRHAALPALRGVNAGAERNLARFCERAARADAYFARQAAALLSAARRTSAAGLPAGARYALAAGEGVWSLEPLRAADPLILAEGMRALAAQLQDLTEDDVQRLCALVECGQGAVQLTAGVGLAAKEGVLWRTSTAPPLFCPFAARPFAPERCTQYPLSGGKMLKTRLCGPFFGEKTQHVHKKDLKNYADYVRITTLHSTLVLRCRQPGDRYHPAGRDGSRPLRKWMNEAGIPPQWRDGLPLLADGSQVLWVWGAGFAEGLAPGPDSVQVLELREQKMEEVES